MLHCLGSLRKVSPCALLGVTTSHVSITRACDHDSFHAASTKNMQHDRCNSHGMFSHPTSSKLSLIAFQLSNASIPIPNQNPSSSFTPVRLQPALGTAFTYLTDTTVSILDGRDVLRDGGWEDRMSRDGGTDKARGWREISDGRKVLIAELLVSRRMVSLLSPS